MVWVLWFSQFTRGFLLPLLKWSTRNFQKIRVKRIISRFSTLLDFAVKNLTLLLLSVKTIGLRKFITSSYDWISPSNRKNMSMMVIKNLLCGSVNFNLNFLVLNFFVTIIALNFAYINNFHFKIILKLKINYRENQDSDRIDSFWFA